MPKNVIFLLQISADKSPSYQQLLRKVVGTRIGLLFAKSTVQNRCFAAVSLMGGVGMFAKKRRVSSMMIALC